MSDAPLSPPTARRSRLAMVAGLAIALVAVAGLVLSLRGGGASAPAASNGEPAPQFRLASLDGRQLGPDDFRGQVLLIDFWATWCGPCHLQADILKELYREKRGRGVEFLAVSVGEEEQIVRDFVAGKPYPYPVLFDPRDELSARLDLAGLPTILIVDRHGRIAFRNDGLTDRRTLAEALAAAGAG